MLNQGAIVHFKPAQAPSRRYAGIAFVGLVHVVLIYALMNGLAPKIAKVVSRDIDTQVIETEIVKPAEAPKPVQPALEKPTIDTVVPPKIPIDASADSPIHAPLAASQPAAADSAASALGATHSIPPYPPVSRRLSHEGTVQLRLTISPEGRVVAADVVQSSGWPELDEAASGWVVAHWRYRPALQDGMAVTSTALAAVRFNLRTAR